MTQFRNASMQKMLQLVYVLMVFTALELKAQPTLLLPLNNATGVSVAALLDWSTMSGASGYDYQVYEGSTLVFEGGPIGSSYVRLTLKYGTTYKWRARGRVLPQNNVWSAYWTFKTEELVPPEHTSPADGAVGVGVPTTLSWASVSGATGYDYQVLENGIVKFENSPGPYNGTSVTLVTDYGATYTWRLRARVAAQDNPWSSYWSFTTAALVAPNLVSPANGATGLDVNLTLDWQGVTGASLYDFRMYKGANLYGEWGPISATSAAATGLDYNTTYSWQARARVSTTQNNPWSGLWSFSTRALVAPNQVSPPNGSVGLGVNVTLDWEGVSGAQGYDYRLYKGTVLQGEWGPISAALVQLNNLDYDTTYSWQVRARVSATQNNPWSGLWTFKTKALVPPVHSAPANGASGVGIPVTLAWQSVADATGYDYQVLSGGVVVVESIGSGPYHGTSVSLDLLYGTTYTWQVRARVGASNPWSSPWSFTTASLVPPTQLSPANGAKDLDINVRLDWQGVAGAIGYDYRVYKGADVYGEWGPITATSGLLSSLDYDTTYAWQARARVATKQTNPWSGLWNFKTKALVPPEHSSPVNGASGVGVPVTLSWHSVTNATGYDYQVLSNGVIVVESIGSGPYRSTSVSLELLYGITYTWQVRARVGPSNPWSSSWSFTTASLVPPTQLSPANGSTNLGISVRLDWQGESGAIGYDYRVFKGSDVYGEWGPTTATSGVVSNLDYNTTYAWQARARVAPKQNNPWSGLWYFKTRGLVAPNQISPADGSVGMDVNVTLDWEGVSGALGYDYRLYKGTVLQGQWGPIPAALVQLKDLDYDTTYSWQVKARVSATQNNPWSGLWSFKTKALVPPAHSSPANGASGVSVPVTLAWHSVSGAIGYDYKVLKDGVVKFSNSSQYNATSVSISANYDTTYTWRLRARVAAENPWSEDWTFRTGAQQGAPRLLHPANKSVDMPLSVNFSWASVPGADGYDFQLCRDGVLVVWNANGPLRSCSTNLDVSYGTTYTWRARARVLPQDNLWSDYWSFTTVPRPVAPALLFPAHLIQVASPVGFSWTPSRSASSYTFELFRGGTLLRRVAGLTGTTFEEPLSAYPLYKWRVTALTDVGDLRSGLNEFSVISTNSGMLTPTFLVPLDNASFLLNEVVTIEVGVMGAEDGEGGDALSQVAQVELFANSVHLATLGAPPFEYDWHPPSAGSYALSALVTGKNNAVGLSYEPVVIAVSNCPACPLIESHPEDQPLLLGATASMSVVAEATPGVSYQWQFLANDAAADDADDVWVNIPNATETALTVPSVNWQHEGYYRVLVKKGQGVSVSRRAMLSLAQDDEDPTITVDTPTYTPIISGRLLSMGISDRNLLRLEADVDQRAQIVEQGLSGPDLSGPSQLVISAIGVANDGTVFLRVNCYSDCRVRVWSSVDLSVWVPVGEATISDGQLIFGSPSEITTQFYRLELIQ